jgi:hypothetical protein
MTARLVAVFVVAAVAPVHAQRAPSDDDTARARTADDSARAHYDAHEYAEAIADYRRAYDAMPDPLYLFDIAQAYRKLGDCTNASALYRNYLRELPTADNRAKVEHFITEMDACATPPPPAAVETTPHAEPPPDRPAPVDEPRGNRILRTTGVITAAVGLVGVGVGIYFSHDAAGRASDLEAACAHGCDARDVASIDADGKTAEHRAVVSYIIGGSAVAAGVGLYLWSTQRTNPHPLIVTPTPNGASVSVRF